MENKITFTEAYNHFNLHVKLMEKLCDVINKASNLKGWEFQRVDNGSGFWLNSPTKKSFSIHFKHGHYGDMNMYLEVYDYNFIKRVDFYYSDDMDDLIINHLLEYENKTIKFD